MKKYFLVCYRLHNRNDPSDIDFMTVIHLIFLSNMDLKALNNTGLTFSVSKFTVIQVPSFV